MLKTLTVFAMCGMAAYAESSLGPPVAAVARDSRKQLRVVYGVAGNFVLGGALGRQAVNWAFSGDSGLLVTETELLRLDASGAPTRSAPAPRSGALLAPGAQSLPLYYSLETGELWQAGTREDQRSPIEPDAIAGSVLAIRSANLRQAELAVCRSNVLWLLTIELHAGLVTREATVGGDLGELACRPPQPGTLLLLRGWLLLATERELIAQSDSGGEHRIPLPGESAAVPRIHQAGEDWVQIERAGHAPLLLRLTLDGGSLYRLPSMAAPR